jgi:hypothetical protein
MDEREKAGENLHRHKVHEVHKVLFVLFVYAYSKLRHKNFHVLRALRAWGNSDASCQALRVSSSASMCVRTLTWARLIP